MTAQMRLPSTIAAAALAAACLAGGASAQGVDRYQFLQLEKEVEALNDEVGRLRAALGSGDLNRRLDALEDEISRLTGQVERLEFGQRRLADEAKRRMDDLEYRIIELEGGDPSVLFENQEEDAPSPLLAPAEPRDQASNAPQGGTLGVIETARPVEGDERAAFDAARAAVEGGDPQGAALMSRFIEDRPDSPLAGDAHYWLGEAYFRNGEYQRAAAAFLDGATLHPAAPRSPESLLRLGVSLSLLGQSDVACSTLREVAQRYPSAQEVIAAAETEAQRSGCG
ncbi:MAG: tol-pal system protein YbgF [Pseudomonadota bacterium]